MDKSAEGTALVASYKSELPFQVSLFVWNRQAVLMVDICEVGSLILEEEKLSRFIVCRPR